MFDPVYRIKSNQILKKGEQAFLASDPHFFHGALASKRGYDSAHEMTKDLHERWNSRVSPSDTVFLLGDVAMDFDRDDLHNLLYSLNGRIYLILGNHDHTLISDGPLLSRFELVQHYLEFIYNRGRGDHYHMVLSHYPLDAWNRSHFGSFQIHGHCHNRIDRKTHRMDVGFDALPDGYWPISVEEAVMMVQEECKRIVYVVEAERWTDDHHYIIGTSENFDDAKRMADEHCEQRAGKYTCKVYGTYPIAHKDRIDHDEVPDVLYIAGSPYKTKRG